MTSKDRSVNNEKKELSKSWLNFIEQIEMFGFGKLEVDIKYGQPVGFWPVVKDGVVQHYTKCD